MSKAIDTSAATATTSEDAADILFNLLNKGESHTNRLHADWDVSCGNIIHRNRFIASYKLDRSFPDRAVIDGVQFSFLATPPGLHVRRLGTIHW